MIFIRQGDGTAQDGRKEKMNEKPIEQKKMVEKAKRRYPQVRDDYFALAALLEEEIDQYRAKINRMQEGRTDSEAGLKAELEGIKKETKQILEEDRILRSDNEMLKDTIVRMAMRIEGVS